MGSPGSCSSCQSMPGLLLLGQLRAAACAMGLLCPALENNRAALISPEQAVTAYTKCAAHLLTASPKLLAPLLSKAVLPM